jgi:hypothetical protein
MTAMTMTEMTPGLEHPVKPTTPPPQLEEIPLAPDASTTAQPAKASLDKELGEAQACDLATVEGIFGRAKAIHDAKEKRDHKQVPVGIPSLLREAISARITGQQMGTTRMPRELKTL